MVIKDGNLLYDLEIHFTRLTKLTKFADLSFTKQI